MVERGSYKSKRCGKQLLRFDGFRYAENITPTDFDAVIEYQNRIWVLFESKLRENSVPYGQRLALQRWIIDAGRAGKHGIAMIVEHDVKDTRRDVLLSNCIVREIYTTEELRWRAPSRRMTAKELSDIYIACYT